MDTPFLNPNVEQVFASYAPNIRTKILTLRDWVFRTAKEYEDVGPLEETLKWGQPSYLTSATGSGTTIRIAQIGNLPDNYGLFVHCQTTLLATYRDLYAGTLIFDGNRCVVFDVDKDPPESAVCHCIALALTYHLK